MRLAGGALVCGELQYANKNFCISETISFSWMTVVPMLFTKGSVNLSESALIFDQNGVMRLFVM